MRKRTLRRRYGRASSYFKPGQFGYVVAATKRGGMHWLDKEGSSAEGETAYLVSKSSHGRGGALWFSGAGIRFTKGGPL